MERRLFSSAIYLNISNFPEENGIEESIITINKTSKRKITDTFLKKFHFIQMENTWLYKSSTINPCQFILAVLKGKDLKVTSARKLFYGIN